MEQRLPIAVHLDTRPDTNTILSARELALTTICLQVHSTNNNRIEVIQVDQLGLSINIALQQLIYNKIFDCTRAPPHLAKD